MLIGEISSKVKNWKPVVLYVQSSSTYEFDPALLTQTPTSVPPSPLLTKPVKVFRELISPS